MSNTKKRIDLFTEHLENTGIIEKTEKGIKINADTLQFGTAEDQDGNRALALIMRSKATHIDQIHVVNSKETLKNLRNTIDKLLYEIAPEVA